MAKEKGENTVFLSSTFKDLQPHRKKIWEVLDSYGFEVKGMEGFGARRTNALDTCIKELHESQIYLGVIGMVYGTVEKNSTKSYTRLEYEEALKRDMEILIYLFDEENGELPMKFVDFKHTNELREFKTYLREKHTVDFFKDADELAKKINTRFKSIITFPKSGFYREKAIKAKVTFIEDIQHWVLVTGYQDKRPVEVFCGKAEGFFLPKWVESGYIIRHERDYNGKKSEQYDFYFEDKDGYKITMEGLNRKFGVSFYLCEAITILLRNNNESVDTILEVARRWDISPDSFKEKLLDALKADLQLKDIAINFSINK